MSCGEAQCILLKLLPLVLLLLLSLLVIMMMMMTTVMRGAGHHSHPSIAPSIGRGELRSAGQVQGRRLSTGPLGRNDAGATPSGDPTVNTDP